MDVIFKSIDSDKGICNGKAVLAGTRFPIWSILAEIAEGDISLKDFSNDFDLNFDMLKMFFRELSRFFENNVIARD